MPVIKKRGAAVKIQQEQEIVTLAHKLQSVTEGYRRQITVVAACILAVLVIYAGYALVRSSREQKAAPLVAQAYELYNPSGAGTADFSRALDQFRDVQKKYPNTVSGAVAQYYIGNCLANLARYDEAISEYQKFVKNYSGEKLLLGLVYQRMGYTYAALGKQDDARKAFEQAETLTGPGIATIELARSYEQAGNSIEAQKKYKTVLDKLSGTSWGMEAMGKVQKIDVAPKSAEQKAAK